MEVEELIMRHEGFRRSIYKCTQGYKTIGYGLNLDVGISRGLAKHILEYQVNQVREECSQMLYWFDELDEVRQTVIIDMVYNLGMAGFLKFKKTIDYIEHGLYLSAGEEMLVSRWARQVGSRAIRLYEMMQSGEWV